MDDVNASSFEVNDFVTEGKAKLLGLDGLMNVITRERPAQAGNGPSKHTLHGLLGDGSGILRLLDGHGSGAGDVSNNDWRTDTAGAVALYPGMGGEDVAGQSLTEVLNHVVSLWLTVDENIQVEFFLDLDDILDLGFNELLILLGSDITLGELVSLDTDFRGLGEGSNGGGREEREVKSLGLLADTGREFGLTLVHGLIDGGLSFLDLGVIGPLGRRTGSDGLGIGFELSLDGGRTLGHSLGDDGQFAGLLDSKAEPILHFWVELLLACKGVGSVEEGAGTSNDNTVLSKLLDSEFNNLNGSLKVGLPDVTAINHTSREGLGRGKGIHNGVELLGVADQVNVDSIEVLEVGEDINVVNNVTKVGGEDNLRGLVTKSTQKFVGGLESSLDLGVEVENQDWFINLDALSASGLELSKQLSIERDEFVDERDRLDGLATVCLGEGEERNRSQKDGAGGDAGLLGLVEVSNGLGVGRQLEFLGILESWLDIVVIRVEPFHHFLRETSSLSKRV